MSILVKQLQACESDATEPKATTVVEGEAMVLHAKTPLPPVPPYEPDPALITYLEKGTKRPRRPGVV